MMKMSHSWPNSLSTPTESAVIYCLEFSGNCSESHGLYLSIFKHRFFHHEDEVCNNFAALPPRFRNPRLLSRAILCNIFWQTLVRTTPALKLTRVNTVLSLGMLLHPWGAEIYLPATNPIIQSGSLSSPTTKFRLQIEKSVRVFTRPRN